MGLAFTRLLDRCQKETWQAGLSRAKRTWTLEIRDQEDELIARTRSTVKAPEVFDRLAVSAAVALGKHKRT